VRKLVLGCGYLGLRVAARWVADGDTVFAVTRSSEKACDFQKNGVLPAIPGTSFADDW
jgi:nucleoside-diphosphate-sugar epimerase